MKTALEKLQMGIYIGERGLGSVTVSEAWRRVEMSLEKLQMFRLCC